MRFLDNVRPHPSPLPQEREKNWPASGSWVQGANIISGNSHPIPLPQCGRGCLNTENRARFGSIEAATVLLKGLWCGRQEQTQAIGNGVVPSEKFDAGAR